MGGVCRMEATNRCLGLRWVGIDCWLRLRDGRRRLGVVVDFVVNFGERVQWFVGLFSFVVVSHFCIELGPI